jgi:hypothetical protein
MPLPNALHSKQRPSDGIHIPYAFEFSGSAARTSSFGYEVRDVGKWARQFDDSTFWMLTYEGSGSNPGPDPPQWQLVASYNALSSSRQVIAGDGLTGGGDLSVDRTFNVGADPSGSILVFPDYITVGALYSDAQHGNLGGGNLHSLATTSSAGFMSADDKLFIDGLTVSGTTVTTTRPLDVSKSLALPGTSSFSARSDHKHDVFTAAPGSLFPTGSNQEGSATSLSRSDHIHALPPFGTTTASFAEGNDVRLSDDRIAYALRSATTVVFISASSAPISGSTLNAISSTQAQWEPKSSGSSISLTTTIPLDVTKSAALVGTSSFAARSDHKHDIETSSSISVGTANSEGSSTSLSRADHVHDHVSVRHLIHFIEEGPAEGFTTGAYKEILPAASPFPSSVTWWTSAAKLIKIVEKIITRNSNQFPTIVEWKMYSTSNVVLTTVTDTYDYSGGILTPAITRSIA